MSTRSQALLFVALLMVAASLSGPASKFVSEVQHNQRIRQINDKIVALESRRPADVSPELWSKCIAWASIAHCNICFSKQHTGYEAMCEYEKELDEKLKGDIDLSTIRWIGERLSETGPHGLSYMTTRMHWFDQWNQIVKL